VRDSIRSLKLNFPALLRCGATNSRTETPKVDDYTDYLFIVAQSVVYGSPTDRLELTEVDIFLGPNYVVTLRKRHVAAVDELFGRACDNQHILTRGADFLAHTILDSLVDLILPDIDGFDLLGRLHQVAAWRQIPK